MKKLFTRLLLMGLIVVSSFSNARASHHVGGQIYIDYIGNTPGLGDKYKVTIEMFYSCEWSPGNGNDSANPRINAMATDTAHLMLYSASSCITEQRIKIPYTGVTDTFNSFCSNINTVNSCNQPFSQNLIYIKRLYADTLTIQTLCSDLNLIIDLGAKNNGIVNLDFYNSAFQKIYFNVLLNTQLKANNNSPRFQSAFTHIAVQNQTKHIFISPYDSDNDSIVVFNEEPMFLDKQYTSGNYVYTPTVIPYITDTPNSWYSLNNPIASTPSNPYTVNPHTGIVSFTPQVQGKFQLAFRVEEYDRATGSLLSTSHKEMQVLVLPTTNTQPDIDTTPMNLTNAVYTSGVGITVNAGSTMSFDINAAVNSSNPVYILSNHAIAAPGSSFNVNMQAGASTGSFSWTPTIADIGTHQVYFQAVDSTCSPSQPMVLQNHSFFTIYVQQPNAIHELSQNNLAVYPNPSNGNLINVETENQLVEDVSLYNVYGKKINPTYSKANNKLIIDISNYPSGWYFIKIKYQNNMISTGKFMKL